jgi:hypothetical protein
MKRLLGILAFALASTLTITYGAGKTANLSWVAPTTYTDTTALPSSDIDHYTISWNGGTAGPTGSLTVPGTATTATVPVPCGSTAFSITVTTGSAAKYPNSTSSPAGPVPYASGITCAPNPPSGLAVQ